MQIDNLEKKIVQLVEVQTTLSALHKKLDDFYSNAHKENDDEALDIISEAYHKLEEGFEHITNEEAFVMEEIIDQTQLNFTLN